MPPQLAAVLGIESIQRVRCLRRGSPRFCDDDAGGAARQTRRQEPFSADSSCGISPGRHLPRDLAAVRSIDEVRTGRIGTPWMGGLAAIDVVRVHFIEEVLAWVEMSNFSIF